MTTKISIGKRKLQEYGGSIAIGIPSDFVDMVQAVKGDEIEIFSNGKDELTLKFIRKAN